MLSNISDKISFWSLFAVIVLLPVFFLPFTKIPIETSKGLLLVVGLAISIIFWTVARFSDGKIILPKSWLLVSGFGIVLAFLLSALFSHAQKVSFFGTMFDTGTFYFILSAFLLMFISSIVLNNSEKIKFIFFGTLISSAAVLVFQSLHLFFPDVLSLGILNAKTDNVLGSWSTLGLFAGFSALVSLFVLEFFSISKIMKILFGVLILLSVLLVAVVNFSVIWGILGVFALIIFIYKISFYSNNSDLQTEVKCRNFPTISFILIMISLLFFMAGQFIGGFLPNRLEVSNLEVRPSFSSTMSVAKSVLIRSPVLGSGPNRFTEMWNIYKPAVINNTAFWNTSFDGGSGLLPTFAITTGSLGILAWLAFLAFLVIAGFKELFIFQKKNTPNMEIVVFFFMSLYLFVASLFYPVGPAIFLLAFAFSGIFIGLSAIKKPEGNITLSFLNDPRKSFFSILLLVAIMVASASAGFKYIERFTSIPYFQKTVSAQTIENAQSSIAKTVSLYSNDLYLRTYAQVYLVKLNSLIAKGSSLSETEKADLQISLDQAINGAQLAIQYNDTNYLNYTLLGSVYESIAPFGVSGAFDKAIDSYKTALTFNPLNPSLELNLARVSFANGKVEEAKDYADQALALKQDYADALITLSQIAKAEGDNTEAFSYAEKALLLYPQNQSLKQYMESLRVSDSSSSISNQEQQTNN